MSRGKPFTSAAASSAASASNSHRKGGQNRKDDSLAVFMNALREFLGLGPLYGEEKKRYSGIRLYAPSSIGRGAQRHQTGYRPQ